VDKRVSKFLRTLINGPYLGILCVDLAGTVVAASSGRWIGRNVNTWSVARSAGDTGGMKGPRASEDFGREIIELAVPIPNPDPPGGSIGHLLLIYDWGGIQRVLDDIRAKLTRLDKHVAALIVDGTGRIIGGVAFDAQPAQRSSLAATAWPATTDYGQRWVHVGDEQTLAVLVGAAPVADPVSNWSVLFVERASEALAAVQRIRDRWILVVIALLLVGLAAAAILARQVMRPLSEVTRATGIIAAHPDLELPLLPVRSRSEVGQLTDSFNKMTNALKRSRDEALSAAKFAFAGELAAMVAHEVRTPLSVMRSSAQMLAASPDTHSPENAELAETIVAEVDRVERVVTGLIELARPMQQRLEPTALGDLLSRAAAFVAAQAQRQHIRISCQVSANGALARCDPEQIYQVILNLLVNALQAIPAGSTIWLRPLPEREATVGFEVGDD
jgi:signal transduction histidine kinase